VRVAALYDVHAMPHALEAVLSEVEREGVDAIVFGGDLFAGPLPRETLALIRPLDARFVRGNADRDAPEFVLERLDEETIAWAAAWPATVELDGVLYCHATPRSDEDILTNASPAEAFDAALDGVTARLVVGGHTHMQFRRGRFANAGSVGMPYEDVTAAFWSIVGDDLEFRRTGFDVERAAAEIRASGWPGAEEFVAENLLAAPSREEATAWMEQRRRGE
jgi:predicted phosphodiesterase